MTELDSTDNNMKVYMNRTLALKVVVVDYLQQLMNDMDTENKQIFL